MTSLPSVARDLEQRFDDYSSDKVDISVRQGLVGKRSGQATLQLGSGDNVNYVSEKPVPGWAVRGCAGSIEYIDLETVVDSDIPIDMIKADIEGAEFDLIDNYPQLLDRTRVIALEFHADFGDIDQAIEKLESHGLVTMQEISTTDTTPVIVFSRE